MALRKRWGCDREIEPQVHDLAKRHGDESALTFGRCYRCSGKDDECPVCNGSNEWRLLRCPNAAVQQWHLDICSIVGYQSVGVLPYAGGWMDQPATVVHAARIVMQEKAAIEAKQRKREETRGA